MTDLDAARREAEEALVAYNSFDRDHSTIIADACVIALRALLAATTPLALAETRWTLCPDYDPEHPQHGDCPRCGGFGAIAATAPAAGEHPLLRTPTPGMDYAPSLFPLAVRRDPPPPRGPSICLNATPPPAPLPPGVREAAEIVCPETLSAERRCGACPTCRCIAEAERLREQLANEEKCHNEIQDRALEISTKLVDAQEEVERLTRERDEWRRHAEEQLADVLRLRFLGIEFASQYGDRALACKYDNSCDDSGREPACIPCAFRSALGLMGVS